MKGDYDRLEGTYKLAGLKRLERFAYVVQTIGIIATFAFLVYIGGAMLNPFYLPIFWAILAALIWIFVLSLEAIAFRLIEIKKRDSESAKFLMADRSMKKAYTIIIVTLIAFAVVFVPFFTEQMEDINKMDGEMELLGGENREDKTQFTSRGRFDFLKVDEINLEVSGDIEGSINVFILKEETYRSGETDYGPGEIVNPDNTEFNDHFSFDMPDRDFGEYYIVLQADERVYVQYEVNYIIPEHITSPLSIVFMVFVISQSAWAITLYPIKKKHSEDAIYR
ncbi:MAG: hypothetical protein R6W73_01980 [Candidatus Saliniplasma sp.]